MTIVGLFQQLAGSLQRAIESLPGMAKPYDEANRPVSHPTPPLDAKQETASDADGQPAEYRASGAFTALALYAMLVATALHLDGYGTLWHAIVGTFTGSMTEARVIDHSLLGLLGALAATITAAMPLAVGANSINNLLYGPVKSHAVGKMFSGIKNHYLLMTSTVAMEELFARLLLLGLPLWLGKGHLSLAWFWVLFLVGNAVWAVIHLANFEDPSERHVLRTLPQFVAGAFFTVVFINFGFFGVLMVHLAYNNLLFSTMRKGLFNRGEHLALAWHGLVAAVSGFFLYEGGKSLTNMAYWLDSNATSYAIPGWSTANYFWGVLMATSLLYVIADLMQFDLYCSDDHRHVYDNLVKAVSIILFAFGAFFVLQALGTPFEMRVAVMAAIFMVVVRTASGSGMARVFWIGIPWLMILLYTTLALGIASPVWFILLAVALVEAVDDLIRVKDRRFEEANGSALALIAPFHSK